MFINVGGDTMFNKRFTDKIDKLIMERFPLIYDFVFDGIVIIYGGTLRNTMMGLPVKDFDFFIITPNGDGGLKEFVRKYKLKYKRNSFSGYKIMYNGFNIDMFAVNDTLDAAIYDADMYVYDVINHSIISCGGIDCFYKGVITQINRRKKPIKIDKKRIKKIAKFTQFVSSKKRVKVKEDKLLWEIKMLKENIKAVIEVIKTGNFLYCYHFLKTSKKTMFLFINFSLFVLLLELIMIFYAGKLIVHSLTLNFDKMLMFIGIIMVLLGISFIIKIISRKYKMILESRMNLYIKKSLLNGVLDFISTYNRLLVDVIKYDIENIVNGFLYANTVIIGGVLQVVLLFVMFLINSCFGVILLIANLIILVLQFRTIEKRNIAYNNRYVNHVVNEDIVNNEIDLKHSFNMGTPKQNVFEDIVFVFKIVVFLGLFVLGVYLLKIECVTISNLILVIMFGTYNLLYLNKINCLINWVFDLNGSGFRVFNLFNKSFYSDDYYGCKYKDECLGKIEFKNVSCNYDYNDKLILKGCSCVIKPNEFVAVISNDKSEQDIFLSLIARLCDISSGDILLDDEIIRTYSSDFIKENIAVASSQPFFFNMSIKANMRLIDDVSFEDIDNMCNVMGIAGYIKNMPKGYDSSATESLNDLERQKLGVVRALLKRRKIVLLNVSLNKEELKKIKTITKKKSTVIVSVDNLDDMSLFDKILVIDKGKVVGVGKHDELINTNSVYRRMCKTK